MIIGCGRLGSSVANFSSAQGYDVIVVDKSENAFAKLDETFSGYAVATDATDVDELAGIGIDTVKELIICTEDDNINLFLAQVCDSVFKVPNIYVRFDDPDKGFLIAGSSIKAIYPFSLSLAALNKLRMGVK